MANGYQVCDRWTDVVLGRETRSLKCSNVFFNGDTIYSYGYHFPLAHALRNKSGEVTTFLLNGDRFSVTTSKHQSWIRETTRRTHVRTVIIPFSVLVAAGIDSTSVELIEASDDRWVERTVERWAPPQGAVWKTVDTYDGRTRTSGTREVLFLSEHSNVEVDVIPQDNGTTLYTWTTTQHWLGESLIRAKSRTHGRTTCRTCKATGNDPAAGEEPADKWSDAWYEWVRKATCPSCRGLGGKYWDRTRTSYYLSGFDRNERRESYFFCELPPKARPSTVEEAYEALKPDTVKLAEQMGRPVLRQGDIFAVPLAGIDKRTLRKQGARFEKRGQLFGTNHVGTEVAYLGDGRTLARGTLTHAPEWRRPDHRRVSLGKRWHVVVKNTVPLTAEGR